MWSDWKEKVKTASPEIPRRLLWDVDWKTFDVQKGRALVAERVAERGQLDDFYTLFKLYGGKKGVKEIYKNEVRSLNPFALAFICAVFGLKKEEMDCYKRQEFRKKCLGLSNDEIFYDTKSKIVFSTFENSTGQK